MYWMRVRHVQVVICATWECDEQDKEGSLGAIRGANEECTAESGRLGDDDGSSTTREVTGIKQRRQGQSTGSADTIYQSQISSSMSPVSANASAGCRWQNRCPTRDASYYASHQSMECSYQIILYSLVKKQPHIKVEIDSPCSQNGGYL